MIEYFKLSKMFSYENKIYIIYKTKTKEIL